MIYLDNAATTRIDDEVLEAMRPFMKEEYGNPGSLHELGAVAKNAVDHAREQVAGFLNCDPSEVIFTSGGSEANSMVMSSYQKVMSKKGKTLNVFISASEHDSIFNYYQHNKHETFNVFYIPNLDDVIMCSDKTGVKPNKDGVAITPSFVSLMHTNNETGNRFNVVGVGSYLKAAYKDCLFHTDCVQAAGFDKIDVKAIKCDYATISSHKIYGPKGVGALYVSNRDLCRNIIYGGEEQEFGLRGGTENVPGIVGFGKACELSNINGEKNAEHILKMRSEFITRVYDELTRIGCCDIISNNSIDQTKTVSLTLHGFDAQTLVLLASTYGLCISAGSACRSHESSPSRALKAIGLSDESARQTIRISFSKYNTVEEVRVAAEIIANCVSVMRNIPSNAK